VKRLRLFTPPSLRTPPGLLTLLGLLSALSCSDEAAPSPSGENCGFEQDAAFTFTEVVLNTAASSADCPEVSAEQVNGAEEPDCDRALRDCELQLSCSFEAIEGLTVRGRGSLRTADSGADLFGAIRVESGNLLCEYQVVATLL
jgi:hypothetical protein